ncbi:DNA ligase, partial [Bienertia sinuspersici]
MVNDNYERYDEPKWDDNDNDDSNYFSKLYKNENMYEEQKWGDILLKPWNLFTDKQHLRDVLRDYCIQCGFSIIILSANNIKYTVSCATEGCAWRLHVGRLPDCMTWAIKSIQNFEHTCVGLESRNPMVNVKWATRVLLEDIRNHNETPKKTLNEKLENRFGITICLSTLYRVRKRALMKIHGGHDVSYSHFVNGIENALANYWPKCDRRICCKHLSKNWKRKFVGPLMFSLFWRACADLGDQSAWTIHKFNPVVTSDVNKSHFVESFNATLGIDRCRPVLTLLE